MKAYNVIITKAPFDNLLSGVILRDQEHANRAHAAFAGSTVQEIEVTDPGTIEFLNSPKHEIDTEAWLQRLAPPAV